MQYQEIHDEYAELLSRQSACAEVLTKLKTGYISTKTISGKQYYYLQNRISGRLISQYIPKDTLDPVQAELDERRQLERETAVVDERLNRLEDAARILDHVLLDKLVLLRRCAAVDALPVEKRAQSIAFGNAITALEGIPASRTVKRSLSLWQSGKGNFRDSYLDTLRRYHLMEL